MIPKTQTLTAAHLVAALTVPWSTRTCLLAQSFGGPDEVRDCGASTAFLQNGDQIRWSDSNAHRLQSRFDNIRHMTAPAAALAVARIAEQLPYTFPVEVVPFTGTRNVVLDAATLEVALSKPWATSTCLIATALGGPNVIESCGVALADTHDGRRIQWTNLDVEEAQSKFDRAHRYEGSGISVDNRALVLAQLREMLPITFAATFALRS